MHPQLDVGDTIYTYHTELCTFDTTTPLVIREVVGDYYKASLASATKLSHEGTLGEPTTLVMKQNMVQDGWVYGVVFVSNERLLSKLKKKTMLWQNIMDRDKEQKKTPCTFNIM
jgi:hypothetical protein